MTIRLLACYGGSADPHGGCLPRSKNDFFTGVLYHRKKIVFALLQAKGIGSAKEI